MAFSSRTFLIFPLIPLLYDQRCARGIFLVGEPACAGRLALIQIKVAWQKNYQKVKNLWQIIADEVLRLWIQKNSESLQVRGAEQLMKKVRLMSLIPQRRGWQAEKAVEAAVTGNFHHEETQRGQKSASSHTFNKIRYEN